MDNNKIIVFIKEYESEGKLERVADVKATLKYAEKLLNSMEEEEIETPEGYVVFSHLIAACEEMERHLQNPLDHQEEDYVGGYFVWLDDWRDEQVAYEEEAMQQDSFEDQFNDPVVVYFYEEVLDELRSLEEAKNHMIEDFNHREEMYKERASGIEFDYWVRINF